MRTPRQLPGWRGAALSEAGSWRGWYHTDRQPGARQETVRWPLPLSMTSRAAAHWRGDQLTMTWPGPGLAARVGDAAGRARSVIDRALSAGSGGPETAQEGER
ncbi:MAG TPA: hypothetical protein VK162_03385 [Streptosporangiaceae bacterium]|nr:hypothetical protein [Streptosporangiaceae bacterium]